MSEFSDISSLQCSIESDKISIALNIGGLGLFFNGHSQSTETCRWILAMIALSADDASILCGIGDQLVLENGRSSWLYWPEESESCMTQIGVAHQTLAGSIGSVRPAEIRLDLWAMSGCQLHWPQKALYDHIKDCLAAFAVQCRDCNPEARPNWMISRADDKALQMDEDYITEVLASSLDCSVAWMVQQINYCKVLKQQLQQEVNGLPIRLSQFLVDLVRGSSAMNWAQFTSLTPDEKNNLLQFIYFVVYHHPLGYGSSADCYPSPREARGQRSSGWTRCGWIDLETCGKALIALGTGDFGSESFLFSLPVALGGISYSMHNRGWVLRPCAEDERQWRLIGKYRLFTLAPIHGDNAVIRRIKNAFIRGDEPTLKTGSYIASESAKQDRDDPTLLTRNE
ncbi:MAG: hypothetical protein Q9222_001559 [Ikaeria aurantiellina]